MLLQDKDYVATNDDLIFNVIGYEHAQDAVLANLKNVDGRKWSQGYQRGLEFLRQNFPYYVREFVCVPLDRVSRYFLAKDGLQSLREASSRTPLESTALELADRLAERLAIPLARFGITDSLLWGGAGEHSDIDLVVAPDLGIDLLERLPAIFDDPTFERLGHDNFSRDETKRQRAAWINRQRTWHKGLFNGCRFSLRAIRNPSTPSNRLGEARWTNIGHAHQESRIASAAESLFFPVIYDLDCGRQVVSYFTRHEGLFRAGDMVLVHAERQQAELPQGNRERLLIAQESHGIRLLDDV